MHEPTLNILLADDDTDDCVFFAEQLMQLLNNGASKLPDVLFLDLNMPRKNGFECLSEIKLSSKLKGLPVIVFSTSFEQEVVNLLYQKGAQYFIRKPPEFMHFREIILQSLELVSKGGLEQPSREHFVLSIQKEKSL
jgi:CheY-like chemotaxis protein